MAQQALMPRCPQVTDWLSREVSESQRHCTVACGDLEVPCLALAQLATYIHSLVYLFHLFRTNSLFIRTLPVRPEVW